MIELKKQLSFNEVVLIILYYSKKNEIKTTRLMKFLFILEDFFNILSTEEVEFIAYNYGPYANDFTTLTKPLITAGVVEEHQISNYSRFYILSNYKKEKISEMIFENYEKNQNYDDILKLIKIFIHYYPEEKTKDLIQIVYYLSEDFTIKSQIKNEILNFPKKYNLATLIKIIDEIPFQDLKLLLKNKKRVSGLLNLYNIHKIKSNDENIEFLTGLIADSINNFRKENVSETIIKILNDYNSKSLLKNIKVSLLAIFTTGNLNLSEDFYRCLIKFLLSSLLLRWPLDNEDALNFHFLFSSFKREIKLGSFFDDLSPLSKEEMNSNLENTEDESYKSTEIMTFLKEKEIENYSEYDLNVRIQKILISHYDHDKEKNNNKFEEEEDREIINELESNSDFDDDDYFKEYPEEESDLNNDLDLI